MSFERNTDEDLWEFGVADLEMGEDSRFHGEPPEQFSLSAFDPDSEAVARLAPRLKQGLDRGDGVVGLWWQNTNHREVSTKD